MKYISSALALAALSVCFLAANTSAQTLAWGSNGRGQLGIGNTATPQPNPQTVTAVPDATGIGSGDEHTLFLKSDGTVMSAGRNNNGQLGTGTTGGDISEPVAVLNLTNVTQVTAGDLHSAALRSDGTVWSWGYAAHGQIGNGTISSNAPTPTQSTITDVIQIEAGTRHTLALKSDGTVWAWGSNLNGQIGNNSTQNALAPVQVGTSVSGFTNIIAVSAGLRHSVALKADGTVWVWGANDTAQIGNGAVGSDQRIPIQNTTLTNVSQIAAGFFHNIARRTDGTVWVWGNNGSGQVGNGVAGGDQLTPVQNTTLAEVVEIAAGGSHNLVRLRDGSVRGWGSNFEGQVGDGTPLNTRLTPVTSAVGMGNAMIAAGLYHSFSLKPSFVTPTGANVINYGENVRLYFDNVTTAGTTSYAAIDPATTGLAVPGGHVIQGNAPAYQITSTATTSGNIFVCLQVPSEFDQTAFTRLKILHEEGGALVDRTYSSTYIRRQICAQVTSFSRFVIVEGLAPTAADVSIGGRVTSANGRGLRNVTVTLQGGTLLAPKRAITSSFGYYSFEGLEAGETYVLMVNAKGYRFATPSRVVNAVDSFADIDFVSNQ